MKQQETGHDPKTDPRNRLAAGIFVAIWASAGWYSLRTNDQVIGVDFGPDPGPGLLPALVLTILTIGSLVLVAAGLSGLKRLEAPPLAWMRMTRQFAMPLLLAASLVGYIPLVRALGFVAGNVLFATAWMVLLGLGELRREPRRTAIRIALGALIGVGLVYFVFVYWIGVPLR